MISDCPEFTDPAMQVIKDTEPDSYAAMQASRWHVHVVTDLETDPVANSEFGFMEWANFPYADGLTLGFEPGRTHGHTLINKSQSLEDARWLHASLPHFLATILLHEFTHYKGRDEVPAFTASIRLARELGDCELASQNEEVRERARTGDYPS